MAIQPLEPSDSMEVAIELNLKSKDGVRYGKESHIFENVFKRLTRGGLHPGKIVLLLLDDNKNYRVVGAFSENIGGSLSFFPDFADKLTKKYTQKTEDGGSLEQPFNHVTLPKGIGRRGHFTGPGNKRHFGKHDIVPIEENLYAWLTIAITDVSGLNDFQNKTRIDFQMKDGKNAEDYISAVNLGISGMIINKFPSRPMANNFGCIQIQLIKKGWKTIPETYFDGNLKSKLCGNPDISPSVLSNSHVFITANELDYDLLIRFFNVRGKPVNDLLLIVSTFNLDNLGF